MASNSNAGYECSKHQETHSNLRMLSIRVVTRQSTSWKDGEVCELLKKDPQHYRALGFHG